MSREFCDWHGREHESMDWQSFRIGGELINVCYRARIGGELINVCYRARIGGELINVCYRARIGGELINVCYRAWGMAEKEELDEAYARADEERKT